jgi:hypothetical protein
MEELRLPVWRLCAAVFILGGMVAVLLLLAPVYLENMRLGVYIRDLAKTSAPDETLRDGVLARARSLNLPVEPDDIHITRSPGKVKVEAKYAVVKDFRLYAVDLHFHPTS